MEIFTGVSVSDPGALEDPPLILTNLGLFLPHNLGPALISLDCTIYDLAGFGSCGYMERFRVLPPHSVSATVGHIFSFATPSIPAAELHAPFGFGRGAHADGGGERVHLAPYLLWQ